MKTLTLILIFIVLFNYNNLMAQGVDSLTPKNRPFQITFISPLGTNGLEAGKIDNKISINIFAGYNGGVSGVEFGGFANNLRYNMNGIQVAGFSNVVLGKSSGLQYSGFSNVNVKSFKGMQVSGFSNVVCDSSKIIQLTGFSNVIKGKTQGIQIAGFSNVITADAVAIQLAGFVNVVKGKTKGVQVAGFVNVSSNDVKGLQVAGFANIASGNIEGVQVSGFLNMAKKLKGLQLGVFNYCDTIEKGIPIGVLSIVRHGYKAFDFGADETLYLNASFLMGVNKFYNKFTVGARPGGNHTYWSYGYGLGSNFQLSKRFDLNVEISANHILVDDWYDHDFNLLNKARLNLLFNLSDNFSLYGGISYNVFVSNETNSEGQYTNSGIVPWSSYSSVQRNCLVEMYPGINVGIRVH
jgi:hypothetical protein